MSTKSNNGQTSGGGDEFEIVDSNSIQYVRRGRKAKADPVLIEKLRALPVGKAMVIRSLQVDPKSPKFANDKARIASQIRTACKAAEMPSGTFQILWTPDGIPQVRR